MKSAVHGGWRVLYVAYPLLTVSEASCGGAEQLLWALDREMSARGHHTWVAASEGSQVTGRLLATGAPAARPDDFERRNREHNESVLKFLAERPDDFDLVHDHGGHFWMHAAEVRLPVLATLHLPRSFYPAGAFDNLPENLFFNCVSQSQLRSFAGVKQVGGVVANGVPLDRFAFSADKQDYLMWMGRICEEKAPHLAIEVAERLGHALVIAGQVYPFTYHQEYFDREILPHLKRAGSRIYFVQKPTFAEKIELLRRAQCVLVPSLVEETSSLVAMEAMACGTPAVVFRRGALPEVVAHGGTGFVVDSAEEMVDAVPATRRLQPPACRKHVEANFSSQRMAADYERLYGLIGFYSQLRQQRVAAA